LSLAEKIHARFFTCEGSDQIASVWALKGLEAWIGNSPPRRVLEIGAGIGTVSALLAQYCRLAEFVVCVEDDPWCRSQWGRNMAFISPTMHLYDKVPLYEQPFDLIVLDGPQMPAEGWRPLVARGGTVFVEGNRRSQRADLLAVLRRDGRRAVQMPSRPPDRSKGFWLVLADAEPWELLWAAWRNGREGWLDFKVRLSGRPVGKRMSHAK